MSNKIPGWKILPCQEPAGLTLIVTQMVQVVHILCKSQGLKRYKRNRYITICNLSLLQLQRLGSAMELKYNFEQDSTWGLLVCVCVCVHAYMYVCVFFLPPFSLNNAATVKTRLTATVAPPPPPPLSPGTPHKFQHCKVLRVGADCCHRKPTAVVFCSDIVGGVIPAPVTDMHTSTDPWPGKDQQMTNPWPGKDR